MKKLLLALALTCSAAHAEMWTGNKLLQSMNGDANDQLLAVGYVIGVVDGLEAKGVCTANKITAGQIGDITKQILVSQPENRHHSAALFVWAAITKNFSCEPAPAKKTKSSQT